MRKQILLLLILALLGCERVHQDHATQASTSLKIRPGQFAEDDRRMLFAQIVEDFDPNSYEESAVLEGAPYKWFLHQVAATNQDALRKQTNDKITFDNLMAQPGLYRGQVVTLSRGVVVEAKKVDLPAEFGLPGYSIILAVFVDAARDVYALRILCAPGSKLFEKLDKGIADDNLPVGRAVGYFMKLYARNTSKPDEPPWRRPLLICPELEFSKLVEPRHIADDLRESGADKLMPSLPLDAPDAEERLIVEVLPSKSKAAPFQIRIGEKVAETDFKPFLAQAVEDLRKRLPTEQTNHPSAVILMRGDAPKQGMDTALAGLRAADVHRLAIKRDAGTQ
jgi:hypothetical protein